MSNDIVTRLRIIQGFSKPIASGYITTAAKDAADEIQRLEEQVFWLRRKLKEVYEGVEND